MKKLEIKLDVTINDEGDLIVNDTKVIDIDDRAKDMTIDFIIKKSQPQYGYLNFPRATGFQDIIKNGRDVTIFYQEKKYNVQSYAPTPGRINGLSAFFEENKIVKGDQLEIKLLVNKTPLEMHIEKKKKNDWIY